MNPNRRKILSAGCCGLMGTTTISSTLLNLSQANAAVGAEKHNDYKALVCILLSGGNDSWNMLIPGAVSYTHLTLPTIYSV